MFIHPSCFYVIRVLEWCVLDRGRAVAAVVLLVVYRPICSLSTSTLCCVCSSGICSCRSGMIRLKRFYYYYYYFTYFSSLLGAPTDHICNRDETVGMLGFLFEDQIFVINACFFLFVSTKNPLEKLSFPPITRPRTPNEWNVRFIVYEKI